MALTPEQICTYQDEGYLVVEEFFTPIEIATLADATDEWTCKAEAGLYQSHAFEFEKSDCDKHSVLRRIVDPAALDPCFERMAINDRILDVIEDLIGHNIEYHHGKLNLKPRLYGSPVDWHQDFPFIPHTNSDLVAVIVYIDDSLENNGCLTIVPGSHKLGPLDHFSEDKFIGMVTADLARVQLNSAVNVTVRSGGISIHHCLTLHRSGPNLSSLSRRVLINQYRAADSAELTPGVSHPYPYGMLLRGQKPKMIRHEPLVCRLPAKSSAQSAFTLQEEYKSKYLTQAIQTGHQ